MCRFSEFRTKEIINSKTGVRMGFIEDVFFDFETGKILSFSVPSSHRFLGFLISREYYSIPYSDIETIGDDVVIVSSMPKLINPKSDRSLWERFLDFFR